MDPSHALGIERHLEWEGCFNVRDLGGLETVDGRRTRRGALVRADGLDRLTGAGWAELERYGIRTVVDLRNDDEIAGDVHSRPESITTVRVPLDDIDDRDFWDDVWDKELDGTPLYYRRFIEEKPERCVGVVATIAEAVLGGVTFHCGLGRDRTGLVSLLVLALAGVHPDDIALDYELSAARLPARFAARGMEDQNAEIEAILRRKNVTIRGLILDLLRSVNLEAHLRSAGLSDGDVTVLRDRFLEPAAR